MRAAVVGATGRIGRLTVEALGRTGHETAGISPTLDVDVYRGDGPAAALTGLDAVIEAEAPQERTPYPHSPGSEMKTHDDVIVIALLALHGGIPTAQRIAGVAQ